MKCLKFQTSVIAVAVFLHPLCRNNGETSFHTKGPRALGFATGRVPALLASLTRGSGKLDLTRGCLTRGCGAGPAWEIAGVFFLCAAGHHQGL